jgi:hypothetical protein
MPPLELRVRNATVSGLAVLNYSLIFALYVTHNLLNVLVQIANKMGLQIKYLPGINSLRLHKVKLSP